MTEEVRTLAKKIWDYHHVGHELGKADCIFALGSNDLRVAKRAAELFLDGYAPLLIFSGGFGRLTQDEWSEPEADKFAAVAMKMGIPSDKIIVENKSTNTGENVLLTKKLLEEKGLDPQSFILVQKPYMERRTYATFKKRWPEKDFIVTSPQISFDDYFDGSVPEDAVLNAMVGDLQRIKIYPDMGFQIPQEISTDAWSAYEQLVALGYDKQLIKE